jgi:hypothetical protein
MQDWAARPLDGGYVAVFIGDQCPFHQRIRKVDRCKIVNPVGCSRYLA